MSAIDELLKAARSRIERVPPALLTAEIEDGSLVIDIRPEHYRRDEGELPGSIAIERNVLEWRLDPTSPDAIPEAAPGRRVILVCNEGYASSLAAAALLDLGLEGATDLDGGYRAWRAFTEGH